MNPIIQLPPLDSLVILTERPGQMYVAHGGKELYVSRADGHVDLFTGHDFNEMSDEEISKHIAQAQAQNV